MKQYPSIDRGGFWTLDSNDFKKKEIIAFDKIDGSNIRAEWSQSKGFYKFGSRKRLIDSNDPQLGEAVNLIKQQEKAFEEVFKAKGDGRAVCFFEFWGDNSAFGSHKDEEHRVNLIDVSLYKKGILDPKIFVKRFEGNVPTAKVLYRGRITHEFIHSVQDGSLEGMGPEGVVCKHGFQQSLGSPFMLKIKRNDWYKRLKEFCNGDRSKFQELQ